MDGFHPENVGLLGQKRPRFVACRPAGIMELLAREGVALSGLRAVVLGRSDIVGKPMALLLMHADATVTVAHSKTPDLAAVTREADVLVAAVGRAGLVRAEHVKAGAAVIDVGMNRVADAAVAAELGGPERAEEFTRRGYCSWATSTPLPCASARARSRRAGGSGPADHRDAHEQHGVRGGADGGPLAVPRRRLGPAC